MKFTPKIPPGCRSVEQHEVALVELAELLEARARGLLAGEARIGLATANALVASAIRAREKAAHLALERQNDEIVNYRLEELRRRRDGGRGQRARLRRKETSE